CLCRLNTPGARKTVLDHVLNRKKFDSEATARLGEFSNSDLSDDEHSLMRLLEALQATFPLKRLGILIPQKDYTARWIAEALSGTTHPSVQQALQELAQRYPDCEAGRTATKARAKLEHIKTAKRTEVPTGSLMGDLEVFGLPSLLQSFADSSVTGTLTLKTSKGDQYATVYVVKGKFRNAQYGIVSGEAAFYQLFE